MTLLQTWARRQSPKRLQRLKALLQIAEALEELSEEIPECWSLATAVRKVTK